MSAVRVLDPGNEVFFGAKTNAHCVLSSIKPGFHMIVPIVWTCFETTGTIRKIRTIIWKQGLNNLEIQRSQLRTKIIFFFFCISWQKLFLHSYFLEFSFILSSSLEYRERERQRKPESRRQASHAQRERERQRARERRRNCTDKQRVTSFVFCLLNCPFWLTLGISTFCSWACRKVFASNPHFVFSSARKEGTRQTSVLLEAKILELMTDLQWSHVYKAAFDCVRKWIQNNWNKL